MIGIDKRVPTNKESEREVRGELPEAVACCVESRKRWFRLISGCLSGAWCRKEAAESTIPARGGVDPTSVFSYKVQPS